MITLLKRSMTLEEINDLYDYGLKIYQNTKFFKFSIDSILLAEFVNLKNNQYILDICTGNAPIPLILSTKKSNIKIDCVEVQKDIYDLAKKSIEKNKLTNTIRVFHKDIKDFQSEKKYDIITCNPPYFKATETSQKNQNEIKRIARHEILLTLQELIEISKTLLKENGTLYLVQRSDRFLETIKLLEKNKFGIRKITFVNTKVDVPSQIFLIEASLSKKSDPKFYTLNTFNLKSYKNIFNKEGTR